MRHVDDEVLMGNIMSLLEPKELGQLAMCSKALYAYAHHDALWRYDVLYNRAF